MPTVWIAETGEYENRGVCGIYDSAERAMGVIGGTWSLLLYEHHRDWPIRTGRELWGDITNGEVDLRPFTMTDEGETATMDAVKVTVAEMPVGAKQWQYRDGMADDLGVWARG